LLGLWTTESLTAATLCGFLDDLFVQSVFSFFRLSEFFYPLLARLDIGASVEQPFGCLIVQNRQAV